jgi:ATP adenylyltransferase
LAHALPARTANPHQASRLARVKHLWAPWRLEYIKSAGDDTGCVFCRAVESDDADSLVLHRGERTIALLNKFPYSSGHFMVAPVRHIAEFGDLAEDEVLELHRLASSGIGALAQTYAPQGYNVGWNLGRIAGAGVVDHVHMHVVPRWGGDTNFMPVLADTKVLPEHLQETRRRLSETWPN